MRLLTLKKKLLFLSLAIASTIGIVSTQALYKNEKSSSSQDTFSSEINIATSSPLGDVNGFVVPASCPSDLHDDPTYGQPCGVCNACGSCNGGGAYQCGGVCSVGAPANPPGYGSACTTVNACGASYSATTTCTGEKAIPWVWLYNTTNNTCGPNEVFFNALPGWEACYAAACSTSNPGAGTIQCNGTCSGTAPPLPIGYGTSCLSAPNTCSMRSTGVIGCAGCTGTIPSDALCSKTLQICENSCSSNIYRAHGSSFLMFDNELARNLVACYTDKVDCSDPDPAANVTAVSIWTEDNSPYDAITLSGTNPKILSPNPLATSGTRSESINVLYSPVPMVNMNSSVQVNVTKLCVSGCTAAQSKSVCIGKTYTATSPTPGCGDVTNTCDGTRICDYWIETTP